MSLEVEEVLLHQKSEYQVPYREFLHPLIQIKIAHQGEKFGFANLSTPNNPNFAWSPVSSR